jgi:hypothetical protein
MNRLSSAFLLRRAYEHLTASAAAIALTVLAVMTVNAHANDTRKLTPSVTIQVPTVEIEVLDDSTAHVASVTNDRVNG